MSCPDVRGVKNVKISFHPCDNSLPDLLNVMADIVKDSFSINVARENITEDGTEYFTFNSTSARMSFQVYISPGVKLDYYQRSVGMDIVVEMYDGTVYTGIDGTRVNGGTAMSNGSTVALDVLFKKGITIIQPGNNI